jgi:hypothetical protein
LYSFTNGGNAEIIFGDGNANWGFSASDARFSLYNYSASSTSIYVSNTDNVGIGTTSPGYKLEVSGNTALSLGADRYLRIGSSTNYWWDLQSVSNDFTLKEAGSNTRLIVKAGGNVGIGTTSPTTNLEVISDTGAVLRLGTSDTVVLDGDTIGRIEFFSSDSTNTNSGVGAFIDLVADGDQNNFAPLGDLRFATSYASAQNATTRMTIKGNGNVGIGTTSPSRKLTIGGIVNTGDGLKIEDPTNTAFGAHLTYYDISSEVWLGGITNNVYNDTLSIHRDATRTITITSTGNVGIGTTAPSKKLHVVGDSYIEASGTGQTLLLERANGQPTIKAGTTQSGHLILDSNAGHIYLNNYVNKNVLIATGGGNVGIGTPSPAEKLHVVGNALISGGTGDATLTIEADTDNITETDNPNILFKQDGGLVTGDIGFEGDADALFVGSLANSFYMVADNSTPLQLGTNNAARLTINGSDGNVGIGTNSPAAKLHVDNNGASTTAVRFDAGATPDAIVAYGNNGNKYFELGEVGSTDPGRISLFESGVSKIQLATNGNSYLNGGNVGIGTTSPNYKLTVGGGSINSIQLLSSSTGTGAFDGLRIWNTGNSVALWNYDNTPTLFGTNNNERMRITSDGNVGIGTTSPNQKLHIVGKGLFTDFVRFNGVTAPDFPIDIDSVDGGKALRSTRGTSIFRIDQSNDGPGYIGMQSADDLSIQTNNTSKIYITSSGNVGIGTTSPAYKLQVAGAFYQNGTSFTNYFDGDTKFGGSNSYSTIVKANGNVGIGTTSPEYTLDVAGVIRVGSGGSIQPLLSRDTSTGGLVVSSVGNSGDFIFKGSGGSEKFRIRDTGNVGIGTTSPNQGLHVVDAGGIVAEFESSNNSVSTLQLTNSSGDSAYFGVASTSLTLGVGAFDSNDLRITSGGNVGIGTTSPGAKLDVAGQIITSDSVRFTANVSTPTGNSVFRPASNTLAIGTNSAERMRITSDGNVGIGTTSPSAKLHVQGTSFFFDQAIFDDKVGIGTTSPSQKLHVSGNARVTGAYYDSNNSAGTSGQVLSSTATGTDWVSLSEISGVDGTGTANYVAKWSDADTITDSLIYDNGTFVGIGTASPEELLHIKNGDAGVTPYDLGTGLNIEGTTSNVGINIISSNTGQGRIYFASPSSNTAGAIEYNHDATLSNGFMKFRTGNSERMRIDGDGYVGIGTPSPIQKLHVVGNGYINAGSLFIDSGQRLKWGNSNQWIEGTSDTSLEFSGGGGGTQMILTSAGRVGIGTTSPDAKFNVTDGGTQVTISNTYLAHLQSASNCGLAITAGASSNNYIAFGDSDNYDEGIISYNNSTRSFAFRTADGTLDDLVIDSSGNVGIGTTNPAGELHVKSASTNANIYIQRSTYDPWRVSAGSTYLAFMQDTSEKMRITSDGNVGIGTTSPDSLVEIENNPAAQTQSRMLSIDNNPINNQGSGYIEISSGSNNQAKTQIEQVSSGGFGLLGNQYIDTNIINRGLSSAAHGNINFATGSSTSATSIVMTIGGGSQKGNVGIGTTNPESKLHLYEASAAPTLLTLHNYQSDIIPNGTQGNFIDFKMTDSNATFTPQVRIGMIVKDTDGDDGIPSEGTGNFVVYTAEGTDSSGNGVLTEHFRITDKGNVGIGTASPTRPLSVYRSTAGSVANFLHYTDATAFAGLYINVDNANDIVELNASGDTASTMAFQTGNAERMRITSGGDVGIGTTNPQARLTLRRESNGSLFELNRVASNVEALYGGVSGNNSYFYGNNGIFTLGINNPDGGLGGEIPYIVMRNGSTRYTTFEAGNVGIGTTSPAHTLSVNGTVSSNFFRGYTYPNNSFLDFDKDDTAASNYTALASIGRIAYLADTNSNEPAANAAHEFFTGTSDIDTATSLMIIQTDGNVGIGTPSPGQKLQVEGNADINGVLYMDYGSIIDDGRFRFGNGNDFSLGFHSSTSTLRLAAGNTLTSDVRLAVDSSGNVGIGNTSPSYKLSVSGGIIAGGKITYTKSYSSLDTTGNAVAGLESATNGQSSLFTFTCFGHTGGYQKIVYSCHNVNGTWNTKKVIDEGTNDFDMEASANGTTITFTFKSTSGTKYYSPKVIVEASGSAINSTYA